MEPPTGINLSSLIPIESYDYDGKDAFQSVESQFDLVIHFAEQADKPFFLDEEKLSTAFMVVQVSLNAFKILQEKNLQQAYKLFDLLATRPLDRCFKDKKTQLYYTRLIEILRESPLIDKAKKHIDVFLMGHQLLNKKLQRAIIVTNFAVVYLSRLTNRQKICFISSRKLVHLEPPIDEKGQAHFKRIASILDRVPTKLVTPADPVVPASKIGQPSVPVVVCSDTSSSPQILECSEPILQYGLDFFTQLFSILGPSPPENEKLKIEKALQTTKALTIAKTPEKHDLQSKKIRILFREIFRNYAPFLLRAPEQSPFKLSFSIFIEKFDALLPSFVNRYFFKVPSHPSVAQQRMALSIIKEIANYLSHLEDEKTAMKSNDPNLYYLQVFSLCEEIILKLLDEENSGKKSKKPVPWHPLVAYLGSIVVMQMVHKFVNPYNLCLIIERLLSQPVDLDDYNPQKADAKLFQVSSVFKSQLAKDFQIILQQILIIGAPKQGLINTQISNLISGKINEQENVETIAERFLQFLYQVKSSDCSMTPLLVTSHILLKKVEGSFNPAFILNEPVPDRPNLPIELKHRVLIMLQPFLVTKLETYANQHDENESFFEGLKKKAVGAIGKLCLSTDICKNFCEHFIKQIWELTQSEESLKLLVLYLLKGIRKGLETK